MFCLRPIPVQLWSRNIQKLSCEIICMVFQSQKEDMPKTTPCVRVIEIPDRKWQSRGEYHLNTWATRGKHMTTMFCISYPGRGGCVWVESSQGNCSPRGWGVVVKANSCFTSIEKILYLSDECMKFIRLHKLRIKQMKMQKWSWQLNKRGVRLHPLLTRLIQFQEP